MGLPRELSPEELYTRTDPESFDFDTTADISEGVEIVGQSRAVESVRFAVGMDQTGYNLFALGSPGTGKRFMVEHFLKRESADRQAPPDVCYVNNFEDPNQPRLLILPRGMAVRLKTDLDELTEEVATALPNIFESEEYQARLQTTQREFKQPHDKKLEELQKLAQDKGFAMTQTQMGISFTPVKEGEAMSQDEFQALPEIDRKQIESSIQDLQHELQSILHSVPRLERELRAKVRDLGQEVVAFAFGHLIDELIERYADTSEVVDYLELVRADLIHHAREFIQPPDGTSGGGPTGPDRSDLARRYGLNVLVDNTETTGAPVIYEDHPVYENLVGRIEHLSQMGTLVTNFNLIKPGALHRANGGYLILDARRLLTQPYAWEGLKRAINSKLIRVESSGQAMGMVSTVTLEPEPISLDVKVVLIGDRMLYYMLCEQDPDFAGLFKVAADFDDHVERTDENEHLYTRLIAELIRKHGLRPFDRGAVARILEQGARLAADRERLSGHIGNLSDLVQECDYWARQSGNDTVTAAGVETAIEAHTHRIDRVRERTQEAILRSTIVIDTGGERVGQINGLAVLQIGNFSFGKPSRITARVRLGKGEVIDIEREVELSGPIHSKGVLILSSFLGARYAQDRPLSLGASLVFEQSYGGVDGDSASSTELYALLSAIAQVPIRQSLAVTGSVNQHGEVQAIGGANQKIEGFFDVCQARGLDGNQGVMIPYANIRNLMLRSDVIEAVKKGSFHIYAVRTIDEGIELLTGIEAGERDADGNFPPDSVNGLVEHRLSQMTEAQIAFAKAAGSTNHQSDAPETND
jgi:lon-related putative ATP-dependent protease